MTAVLPVSALLLSSPALPAHRGLEITLVAAQTAQRKARVPPPVKEPAVQTMTDARADAAGRTQLFERVPVPGFTDLRQGFNGTAVADLDSRRSPRFGRHLGRADNSGWGAWRHAAPYLPQPGGLPLSRERHPDNWTGRSQRRQLSRPRSVPVLADFNLDGFLDLFVTRSTPMNAGSFCRHRSAIRSS